MEYLNSICGGELTKLSSREKRVKHVLSQIHVQQRHDWMIELSVFTKKAIHKPIVYAISLAQEVAEFFEFGPPEYSLPFDHLKKLDMSDVSSIMAPQTIEDVVEGVYDMTREEMKDILTVICDTENTKEYLLLVTKLMARGRGETNENVYESPSDVEDDMMLGEDYDKEAMELDDIISWTLKLLRLKNDISVDTKWNPDSKRKDDPYDVIFKVQGDSHEKITGKKSWRNYIKTLGKKVYENKMDKIKGEIHVSYDNDVDDWVFVAYYILSQSRVFRERANVFLHRLAGEDMKTLPERSIDDVIKVFSKVKDENELESLCGTIINTFKENPNGSFIQQMYDGLWGGERQKHHTHKSPEKKRIHDQEQDIPTQVSQKSKTPKKRGRPKKNTEDTTKKAKKKTREKENRQSDVASKLAAEALRSLGDDPPPYDFRVPPSAVIRSGYGKIITKEAFSTLANGISAMYDVSWNDMTTYLVSGTGDEHRGRYLEIYRKISESLYFDSTKPLTATFVSDGQEKTISISQMDVVHFFTEIMMHEKLTSAILNMKAEIDTNRGIMHHQY